MKEVLYGMFFGVVIAVGMIAAMLCHLYIF